MPRSPTVEAVIREDRTAPTGAVDLLDRRGLGPLWRMASTDLDATLPAWPAGHEVAEHVNPDQGLE